MPDLLPQFFSGTSDITTTTASSLSTNSSGLALRDTLTSLGWSGKSVATICLTLSTDGSRVTNGRFGLWGALSDDPVEFPASKLWDNTQRGITIKLANISGQQFRFSSGQLQSDYADSDTFEVSAFQGGLEIPPQDWPNSGIGNLALRAIVHLDKTSNRLAQPICKVTILAVPLNANELTNLSESVVCEPWAR